MLQNVNKYCGPRHFGYKKSQFLSPQKIIYELYNNDHQKASGFDKEMQHSQTTDIPMALVPSTAYTEH